MDQPLSFSNKQDTQYALYMDRIGLLNVGVLLPVATSIRGCDGQYFRSPPKVHFREFPEKH